MRLILSRESTQVIQREEMPRLRFFFWYFGEKVSHASGILPHLFTVLETYFCSLIKILNVCDGQLVDIVILASQTQSSRAYRE